MTPRLADVPDVPDVQHRRRTTDQVHLAYHAAVCVDIVEQAALLIQARLELIAESTSADGPRRLDAPAVTTLASVQTDLERISVQLAAIHGRLRFSAGRLAP